MLSGEPGSGQREAVLLSRVEAQFDFGFYSDGAASPDKGLITNLIPIKCLTELRTGFEFGNFPCRADDDFAANRCPGGLPKGRPLNERTLKKRTALFISGHRGSGDALVVVRGLFVRCRGRFAILLGRNGLYPHNEEHIPGGIPRHSGAQHPSL